MGTLIAAAPDPQARLRLFCFPYAGGGSARYYTWQNRLPAAVQVCPVQLPGRESRRREPSITRMDELVEVLATGLAGHMNSPFAFFGHSMGGLIAFALTCHLRRLHQPLPAHLFISSTPSPQLPDLAPPMHELPEPALIRELARRYGGIPAPILADREMLAIYLTITRADLALMESFHWSGEEPLLTPLTIYGGEQDRFIAVEVLESWRPLTAAPFQLRLFPGDHFYLQSNPQTLLNTLGTALEPLL